MPDTDPETNPERVIESILNEYDQKAALYSRFGNSIRETLNRLLESHIQQQKKKGHSPLKIFPVGMRLKERETLKKKIILREKYRALSDIHDIVGIRIITYLPSQVDIVAGIIEKTFSVDQNNSEDKRHQDPHTFGYQSLHYVVGMTSDRLLLPENKDYENLKLEIQVRTILQHAWAEIEHGMGYKQEKEIPDPSRRAFNRLSALLETADVEFERLNKDLIGYRQNIGAKIKINGDTMPINKDSLQALVETHPLFDNIRKKMKKEYRCEFFESNDYVEVIARLELLEIRAIQELTSALKERAGHFLRFIDLFLKQRNPRNAQLIRAAPLFYFLHFMAAEKGEAFFQTYRVINKESRSYRVASKIDFCQLYEKSQK